MSEIVKGHKNLISMYQIVLFLHSWIRWLLLILSVIVVFRSLSGWIKKSEYKKSDNLGSAILVGLFDIQLLLGLLLYFVLSPLTSAAFNDFGKAMQDPALRFWAVEHIFIMVLAVIVAHLGRNFSKKASDDHSKFRIQSIYFLLSIILIFSMIPWHESARLFRGITN